MGCDVAKTVAALYVQRGGAYWDLPDVDPWDEERDARLYAGPHPVVAHPPCARWGRFAETAFGKAIGIRGDDGGCFRAALDAVCKWGGVLEHPEGSAAFAAHGIPRPARAGWSSAIDGGWVCRVEQGHYGHVCPKPTWLYFNTPENRGVALPPDLIWGKSRPSKFVNSPHGSDTFLWIPKLARSATPPAFRDLLLALARGVA